MAVFDAFEHATGVLDNRTAVGIAVVIDRTVATRQTALVATSAVPRVDLDSSEKAAASERLALDMVD
jgi:site-specific recombinase